MAVVDAPVGVEPKLRPVDIAEGVAPVDLGSRFGIAVGADREVGLVGESAERDLERLLR